MGARAIMKRFNLIHGMVRSCYVWTTEKPGPETGQPPHSNTLKTRRRYVISMAFSSDCHEYGKLDVRLSVL